MVAGRPRQFDYNEALEKAMHVFWTKGYEGTSMPDLTEAMGMNRPSIYAAFGNKEELFKKALERYYGNALEMVRKKMDAPTVRESVEQFFCAVATTFTCKEQPRGCFAVLGALVGGDDSEAVRVFAKDRRNGILDALHERLVRGVKEGDLPVGTDTMALARFFVTVLQGMTVQSRTGASNEDLRKVAQQALGVLPLI
jgi:AcrR family transcriptional regulator